MIDRKLYLEMCQAVSVLPSTILGIKRNVPDDLKVIYNDVVYYPISIEIGFNEESKVINTAIIHSLIANSVVKTNLGDLELYENKRNN